MTVDERWPGCVPALWSKCPQSKKAKSLYWGANSAGNDGAAASRPLSSVETRIDVPQTSRSLAKA